MQNFELADGVASIDPLQWNTLVGEESPFLEWGWLAALENASCVGNGTGWKACPLVAREGKQLVAACPLYLKSHSEGEFIFDWGWADAAAGAGIEYYPKLLVGVPFTPVTGARFLIKPGQDQSRWRAALAQALRETCLGNDLSGVHVNFCKDDELEPLESLGFHVRFGLQYHWRNDHYTSFDDYLSRFRSKRRNQIKRERRQLGEQGVVVEAFTGEEISDALFEAMYEFYVQNVRNHHWGRQYLNWSLFELLREHFRERLVFIVARHGQRWIGGTFNVKKGNVLYGRYWGATHELRFLHFNVCYYAAIEYCIQSGLSRFEPGAGGEYKQLRGFDAYPTRSAHFLSDGRLSDAVARFLREERDRVEETIKWYAERSALKPKAPAMEP